MTVDLQTVHIRVNDSTTGQPTPVRVRFTDADGNYYPPLGRLADFATGRNQDVGGNVRLGMQPWAYVEGSFEIKLPAGSIQVEMCKGLEYQPLSERVVRQAGKLALRFNIERRLDLPSRGWYSGDGRAHFLSPHAALLEAQAEDLHVVNLLAAPTEVSTPSGKKTALSNILGFSGQRPTLATAGYLVVVNTHNAHPVLGSLGLLNCHRIVFPLTFGGPAGKDDWTLADWCDQCHRKKGLVTWTRAGQHNADFFLGEPVVDLLLGKIDAFEIDHFEDSPFDTLPIWYDLLAGITVPLIGSSGKESNASALGVMRTYAHLQPGQELNYQNWIEAVRSGRSFITNGPILLLTVNDQEPGGVLRLHKPGEAVRVRADILNPTTDQTLEILVNGTVAAAAQTPTLDIHLPIQEGGWLAARCRGAQQVFDCPANQCLFAHTSPVYLRIKDQPEHGSLVAVEKLRVQVDRMESWARQEANCPTERDRERFLALVEAGRAVLQAKSRTINSPE
jgi:hypothetical protein